jgi:hypothetical protein
MRIRDNKTGKLEGLPKLKMKSKGCPILTMEVGDAFWIK